MSHDLWYLRSSSGSTLDQTRPSGFEHHVIAKRGRAIDQRSEVRFDSYGEQHYEIAAKGNVKQPQSHYEDHVRGFTVEASLRKGAWAGTVEGDVSGSFSIDVPDDEDVMPSIMARFLPMWLPQEAGEVARCFVVPEDGYPAWRPPGRDPFFPVGSDEPTLRQIVGRGQEVLPMATEPAFRFDHVEDGELVAATWVDKRDRPVAYEQPGCLLLLAREADAKAAFRYS